MFGSSEYIRIKRILSNTSKQSDQYGCFEKKDGYKDRHTGLGKKDHHLWHSLLISKELVGPIVDIGQRSQATSNQATLQHKKVVSSSRRNSRGGGRDDLTESNPVLTLFLFFQLLQFSFPLSLAFVLPPRVSVQSFSSEFDQFGFVPVDVILQDLVQVGEGD
jgi:hypothetical protein